MKSLVANTQAWLQTKDRGRADFFIKRVATFNLEDIKTKVESKPIVK